MKSLYFQAVLAMNFACAIAVPAVAQEASQTLEQVNVKDKALHDDTRPKLEHYAGFSYEF